MPKERLTVKSILVRYLILIRYNAGCMQQDEKRINTNPRIASHEVKANRNFPNSELPLLVYKNVINLGKQKKRSAELMRIIFLKHNWKNSWTNGIYGFHHYHSNTHECLGIASGRATVVFGGPRGKRIQVKQGDVIIIPAGMSHKCSMASKDFLCVGAYPRGVNYDILLGKKEELEKAVKRISKLGIPKTDPVFGKEGFLKSFWS
jgi:uncharacterized protein YjlB